MMRRSGGNEKLKPIEPETQQETQQDILEWRGLNDAQERANKKLKPIEPENL